MASMPPSSGGGGLSPGASAGLSFIASIGINYVLGRFTAQDGPRLGNLSASGGDYGVPMPKGFGYANRVTGAFIGQADIDEDRHKIGSKGIATVAGAIGGAAQGFMIGGPVGAVIGGAIGGLLGFASPNQYYYTYSDTFDCLLLDRLGDDPAEGLLKVWAANRKIFDASGATVVAEVFGSDGQLISRKYKKNKFFKSLTFYAGHREQATPDPIMAGQQEVAEFSGFPFICHVVIEDLELAPFGNTVPSTEYLVQCKSGQTIAAIVEIVASAANIDPQRDISTTALAQDTSRGYLITEESTCWDAIKPLMPVFLADAAEVSGQIRCYKRNQFMRATIRLEEMGAYAYGDQPPVKFSFGREGDLALPKETSLTFIDPDREYQPNSMTSRRSEGNSASNVQVQLKIVLTASEGAAAAAVMHWDQWLGRTGVRFTLMDNWNSLAVGYAYGIPVDDEVVPFCIKRRTRGDNGIIEVEAASDESVTYLATGSGSSGNLPDDDSSTEFADTRLILIDGPILSDDHDDYGFYLAMAGTEADWPRGLVQGSGDAGATWADLLDRQEQAVMGDIVGTIAAGSTTGLDDTLDTTTVVTVTLLHSGMVLESATDDELEQFANFFWAGKDGQGEYFQAKTVTPLGNNQYELTDLLRGRKGTDHAIGTHTSGEEFVMLGAEGGYYRMVYSSDYDWGNPMKFRGVTLHQDEADAPVEDFTNTGEGKRPYSPYNVQGSWDGSNNLTGTFTARSRLNAGGLGIDDNFEFEVVITNATPDRTIIVTAETFNYSAADQLADGITPGHDIIGRVRQTSDVNNGRWRDFTLSGPLGP